MAEALNMAGYRVYEAVEVSEALYLCEYYNIAAVLIARDVEDQFILHCCPRK